MGLHKIFVIAKVSERYRCLASVYHSELYEAGALRICLGLINIFQCPGNRRGLKHELRYAAKQRWTAENQITGCTFADPTILASEPRYVYFPLIMTCLLVGASADDRIPGNLWGGVGPLPLDRPFDWGANEEGVTIIDISNLANIRYCFVSYRGLDGRYDESIPTMVPLSGATYLSAYQRKPDDEQSFSTWTIALDQLLEKFQTIPLVDFETLNEAWPRDGWSSGEFEGDPEYADDASFAEGNIGSGMPDTSGEATEPAPSYEGMATRTTRLCLRDMAMEKVLIELVKLSEEELESVVVEAEKLFDFRRVALRWLENRPDVLKERPAGIALLARVLIGEKLVDLSKFPKLTNKEIAMLFKKASLSDTVEVLDLSGINAITDDILELILLSKSLKALYTLDTPGLTLSKTFDTIYPLSVKALYHTDFFRRAYVADSRTQLDLENSSNPARPIQLLFGTIRDVDTAPHSEFLINAFDIRDALLGPEMPMFFLSRLILHCCDPRARETDRQSLLTYLAARYACDYQIGAIPGNSHVPNNSRAINLPRYIRPGEWTIVVVINELSDDKCVKYAMVTVDQKKALKVVDFPTFIRLAAGEQDSHHCDPGKDQWGTQMEAKVAEMTEQSAGKGWTVQLCTETEVQELVLYIERTQAEMGESLTETAVLHC